MVAKWVGIGLTQKWASLSVCNPLVMPPVRVEQKGSGMRQPMGEGFVVFNATKVEE